MYESYGERGGKKKHKFLNRGIIEDHWVKYSIIVGSRSITLADLDLWMDTQKGDEGDHDFPCDPKFMIGVMDNVCNANLSAYYSIGLDDKKLFYLAMDSMERHEKNEAVLEYIEYLESTYNIVI